MGTQEKILKKNNIYFIYVYKIHFFLYDKQIKVS